jgi:hypothetical protein
MNCRNYRKAFYNVNRPNRAESWKPCNSPAKSCLSTHDGLFCSEACHGGERCSRCPRRCGCVEDCKLDCPLVKMGIACPKDSHPGMECSNNREFNEQYPAGVVMESPGAGDGYYAAQFTAAGTHIGEYTGTTRIDDGKGGAYLQYFKSSLGEHYHWRSLM